MKTMGMLRGGLCLLFLAVATGAAGAEKKPVTNADVAAMIKAGLSENTIVLAIRQGPGDFDTSPAALIQLKSQGATAGMLDAMLQFQTHAAPADADGAPLPDVRNIYLLQGTNRVALKYAILQPGRRSGLASALSFLPIPSFKATSVLSGTQSTCRTACRTPTFEFAMRPDAQPPTRVALIAFTLRDENRSIPSTSNRVTGVALEFPQERTIPLAVTAHETGSPVPANALTRYTAVPGAPLAPGEYALVFGQGMACDFGVNETNVTARAAAPAKK